MRKLLSVAIPLVLLVGCVSSINKKNAASYYDWGVQAELAGDYELAERNYGRALINARLGNSPDAGISASMYGLGRMKGYLCKFGEAEELLVESLKLEEKASGPESGITTKRLFELARFYSDRGFFEQSLPYFERGIPAVKKLGVESSDPIALAEALEEYSVALNSTGRGNLANSTLEEAKALRAGNPGVNARYEPVRYGKDCANSRA